MTRREFVLEGIDGSNPLAFLAAIGTLRSLTLLAPADPVTMHWKPTGGAWRPVVAASAFADEDDLVDRLSTWLANVPVDETFGFADDLAVPAGDFRDHALSVVDLATGSRHETDQRPLEFASAFGCDALVLEDGKIKDTALRTMSGAGHQHFLAFMRGIVKTTESSHIRRTLFETWTYDDPVSGQSLRWDPQEDSRYALQWRNPSGDPSRNVRGTMLGANRLAIEGMPLVATAPERRTLRTIGFVGRGARDTFWTWPIWGCAISLDSCRSLLALSTLTRDERSAFTELRAIGVATAFRSQRITVGKFRNFTNAKALF